MTHGGHEIRFGPGGIFSLFLRFKKFFLYPLLLFKLYLKFLIRRF